MESEDTMDTVDESLKTLLRGEVLPLQEVDASYIPEEHRKSKYGNDTIRSDKDSIWNT